MNERGPWDVRWHPDSARTTKLDWQSSGGERPFENPVDLAIASDGNLFVLDAGAARIIRLSASGEVITSFGRSGEGPGELGGGLTRLVLGPDGIIYVPNPSARRLEEFDRAGKHLGSLAMPFGSGLPVGYAVFGSNLVYRASSTLGRDSDGRGVIEPIVHVVRLYPDTVEEVAQLSAGTQPHTGLYTAMPLWAVTEAGVVLSSTDGFHLQFFDSTFSHLMDWSSSQPLAPIRPADGKVLANQTFSHLEPTQRQQTIAALTERVGFAANYPPWSAILVADNGDVWLNCPATAADVSTGQVVDFTFDMTGSPRWLVYTRDGKRSLEVQVPVGFRLKQVHAGRLYGIGISADGSPVVQALEVAPGE